MKTPMTEEVWMRHKVEQLRLLSMARERLATVHERCYQYLCQRVLDGNLLPEELLRWIELKES